MTDYGLILNLIYSNIHEKRITIQKYIENSYITEFNNQVFHNRGTSAMKHWDKASSCSFIIGTRAFLPI